MKRRKIRKIQKKEPSIIFTTHKIIYMNKCQMYAKTK